MTEKEFNLSEEIGSIGNAEYFHFKDDAKKWNKKFQNKQS